MNQWRQKGSKMILHIGSTLKTGETMTDSPLIPHFYLQQEELTRRINYDFQLKLENQGHLRGSVG